MTGEKLLTIQPVKGMGEMGKVLFVKNEVIIYTLNNSKKNNYIHNLKIIGKVLYKKSGNHTKNGVTIHIFPTKIGIRIQHKELTGKVNLSNYVGDARTNTGVLSNTFGQEVEC